MTALLTYIGLSLAFTYGLWVFYLAVVNLTSVCVTYTAFRLGRCDSATPC